MIDACRRHAVVMAAAGLAIGLGAVASADADVGGGHRADLKVAAVSTPPSTLEPGARFRIRDKITNVGGRRARRSKTLYFLSVNREFGDADPRLRGRGEVHGLEPDRHARGHARVTVPAQVSPGRRRVLACADGKRSLREFREDNNCRVAPRPTVIAGVSTAATPSLRPPPGGEPPTEPPAPPHGPNILLIVTDDQALRDGMAYMPATRRVFGSQGVTYSDAVVTTPLCCPSRASIFTGQYVHNHGVAINDGTFLDPSHTWQRALRSVGYRTGIIGKYLNGIAATSAPYFDYRRLLGLDDPNETRVARRYADEFLDAAEAEDSRPWALVVAVNSPHYPWTVTPEHPADLGSFTPTPAFGEADLSDKHPAVERWSDVKGWYPNWFRTSREPYLRELEATDEMIGGLFDDLGRHGEEHQTLAFFISDNGLMRDEHRLSSKMWPYLESVRVPFYARWPERMVGGSIDPRLAANIDIAPTIYDAAGLAPGYPVDGRSLLAPARRSWFFLEYPRMAYGPPAPPPWSAYLTPTRHYIRWKDGFVEDYDLRSDPAEMTASNAVDPTIARLLDQAQACVGSACP